MAFHPEIEAAIQEAARAYGLDPQLLRTFASIESSGRPNVRTGSYKGLFQLSDREYARYGGQGNIYDPRSNAMVAALKLKAESSDYERAYGRPPSASELYMIHQQGRGGYDAHTRNPDRPAWLNMYSTAEGRQKGPEWARQAIWGNVPADVRGRYSPNMSSREFLDLWNQKVARHGGQPVAPGGQMPALDSEAYKAYHAPDFVPPPGYNPVQTSEVDPAQYPQGLPPGRMAVGAPPPPDALPDPVASSPDMSPGPEPMPEPKIPPITITPPPQPNTARSIGDAPDPAGDAIRQRAVNNQAKPQERPWNAPPINPPPWQGLANIFGGEGGVSPFAGSFFNKLDGSGYKSGGAVKASKDTAKYRGHPNRGDKCRDCTMFTAPHGCTAVRGAISPYGWCSYFEATPTAVALAIKKAAGKVERNPTELQKEWGNYSMGHFNWQGLAITLENPKGSIRRGKTWEVKMPAAYGYIKKTLGRDGDHVDVYVGDDHASDKVWVIDQVDAATGKFDEHKCMLSFKSQAQAVATYNKGFSDGKGPDRMGAITEKSVAEFLQWIEKGDTKKPLGKIRAKKSANVIPNTRVDASLDTARKWGR